MTKICGIYKITNKVNGKCYIGQSIDIIKRWKTEYKWYHVNKHLLAAFNKYGLENFNFEIIEECEPSLLNEREQFWIGIYNSFDRNFGYNKTLGGAGTPGRTFVMSEETKNKIRLANTGHKFTSEQLDEFRNIIRDNQIVIYCYETNKYYTSIGNAARELNICKEAIRHVIMKQGSQALNYRFCKITDNINDFITNCQQVDIYIKEHNLSLKQYYNKINRPDKKKVKCIETGIIYESIVDASKETGLNESCISKCCNKTQTSCKGYHFEFINDTDVGKNIITDPIKRKIIHDKLSAKMTGRNPSEKTREKLSQAHSGRKLSDEHKQKIGLAGKGRKLSDETKQKMSISKKNTEYIIKSRKPVKCIETGQIWESIEDAEKETGLQVSRCCRGLYLNTGNLHFEFVNSMDNEEFLEAKIKLKQNWLKTHKPVYCFNNNKIYKTNVAAEKELGTEHHKITNSCNKNKPCKDGYQYRWLTEEEIDKWIKNCLI